MSYEDICKQVRSTIWLDTVPFGIPESILKKPPVACSRRKPVKIGYLDDGFELYIMKLTENHLKISLFRIRPTPEAKTDDGYILKFHFTMVGFDEETQVDFMKHDENEVSATFKLSEATLKKLNSINYLYELIVVVEVLEIKSLDDMDPRKRVIEAFMEFLKEKLTDGAIRNLGRILKRPELKDVFTGRMPLSHLKGVMNIIVLMSKEFPKIVKYLDARSEHKESDSDDLDLGRLLHYVALQDRENPIPNEIAVQQYLIAHRLGVDCYRTLTSDYLVRILGEDAIVLDILEAALFVQDKVMFEKAVFCFLNNFHKVIRSEKFQHLSRTKGFVARLIIHATRVWVTNNNVYIPGWAQSALPTTEL